MPTAATLNAPRGLATDAADNLYISDYGNSRILTYRLNSTTATAVFGQADFTHVWPNRHGQGQGQGQGQGVFIVDFSHFA